MEPSAPPVLSAADLTSQGLLADSRLAPDMRITSDNPVFGQGAAQDYQQRYFDMAIRPMIEDSKIMQFGAGLDNSTFGATNVSNTALQGAKQAFFAGQDFRNQEINNTLNRRNNLFGNNIQLAGNQNALDVQRGLNLEGIRTQRLNDINSFNMGNAGLGSQFNLGSAGLLGEMDNQAQNRQMMAGMARSQSLGNLVGGAFGLGGGLLNTYMGRKMPVKLSF